MDASTRRYTSCGPQIGIGPLLNGHLSHTSEDSDGSLSNLDSGTDEDNDILALLSSRESRFESASTSISSGYSTTLPVTPMRIAGGSTFRDGIPWAALAFSMLFSAR